MDKRAVLKNEYLTVEISSFGAELKSITDSEGTQRLWQGDPQWWDGQSPLLFPVCGRMTESRYLHKGTSYEMPPHGFAKDSIFKVESEEDTKVVYLLVSDDETRKVYPFEFELRVIYELIENKIAVTYVVNNKSDEDIYFSIGSHEAFICKGKIEDYKMIFEKSEPLLINHLLDGPLLNGKSEEKILENGALSFCDEEFKKLDTLIFINTESKRVKLTGNNSDNSISVEFPGTDNLLIWKEPGAEFLCIEPWCGLPDYVGEVREISQKAAINKLEKNGVFKKTHTIIID